MPIGGDEIPQDVRAAYLKASREAVPSIVAGYRATAAVDAEDDEAGLRAGRRLRMPVSVLRQDRGATLGFDAAGRRRAWADDLDRRTVSCGHFMAEEAPEEVAGAIRDLLDRRPTA
ncbi:alpha/beta fold hydrolase [Nonomuraea sp. NPDC049309]|uniref:alpha/beta fold hydrolase n=1 Tax=Nonomuraea sp. NPDC049309 TaxID=3364350 RepID=UPI00371F7716